MDKLDNEELRKIEKDSLGYLKLLDTAADSVNKWVEKLGNTLLDDDILPEVKKRILTDETVAMGLSLVESVWLKNHFEHVDKVGSMKQFKKDELLNTILPSMIRAKLILALKEARIKYEGEK